MALLKILVAPDPRLKIKAKPIKQVDAEVKQLMNDMLETMYAAPGIGLAATQVGVDKRVIVVDVSNIKEGETPNPIKLANPEIVEASENEVEVQEGCLSVPTFYEDVVRAETCIVKGLDENNREITIKAEGWLAICLQHEIDHLNGVLFVDHLSRTKRSMILKKLQKAKKAGQFDDNGSPNDKNVAL